MQRKACHHLINTSAYEKCLLPSPQTPSLHLGMWNITFHVLCGFPCSSRALSVFQRCKSSVKGTSSCWSVSGSWFNMTSVIPEMREVSSDLTMTLCPDFQMVLMLFINLETSHWHGSQPGLNALGVTRAVWARGQWGSPKFLSGLHLTGQVSILPPSAFGKIRWRWLSTQESCVLFVFVSSSHLL